jgi:deoxyadenosine/deoxycytidine kinase
MVIIDVDDLDFVENKDDLGTVLTEIDKGLAKIA